MRQEIFIEYNNQSLNFIELIYYDGAKLLVDLNNSIVLAWYDEKETLEEWFFIKLQKSLLVKYLSNKISLYDILIKGKTYQLNREYKSYNLLKKIEEVLEFSKYELPDKDSYLGFDFTEEDIYLKNFYKRSAKSSNIYMSDNLESSSNRRYKLNYSSRKASEEPIVYQYKWNNNEAA